MVGVPGKSKGCHTCRKRKIRCDQGRPVCGQCLKSGRDCGGYERLRIFLNNFADQYRSGTSDRGSEKVGTSEATAHHSTKQEDGKIIILAAQFPKSEDVAINTKAFDTLKSAYVVESSVPKLIGFEHLQSDEALRTFLSCSLPSGAREEVPLAWLYSVLDIAKDTPALPYAIAALSYGWLGNVEEAPLVAGRGRSFYIGAIHHLHSALRTDPATHSDAILATMECLALYEMFEFGIDSEAGWLAHLSGLEVIIKLRGPQMHIAGFGNKMFMFFRTIEIFKATICRKSTFLTDPEWQYVPWTLNTKNAFHQYIDIAAEVPHLLEQADNISTNVSTSTAALNLLHSISTLITRMDTWAAQSGIKLPAGPPNITSTTTTTTTVATTRHQYVYSPIALKQASLPKSQRKHYYPSKSPQDLGTPFDTLQSARLLIGLWTSQLCLYTTIYKNRALSKCLLERVDSPSSSLENLSRANATRTADRVALWSDFCTQNAWQSFGPVIALFTLRTAVRWYLLDRDHELDGIVYSRQPELDKCLDLLCQMPGSDRSDSII